MTGPAGVPAVPATGGGRRVVIAGAATALVVAALFSGALDNGFVSWDDQFYITDNPRLKVSSTDDLLWFFTHSHYWSYIPVTLLSHAADYALWGLDPRGHHLTSVLIHAANSVWVFLLALTLIRLIRKRTGMASGEDGPLPGEILPALVATALFAVHPLRVESVAWVSDRKDLLCAFFLFPSFLLYVRARIRWGDKLPGRVVAGILLLYVLALLSKAIALVFPVVLAAADPLLLGRDRWRPVWKPLVREKTPFLIASALVGIVGLMVVPEHGLNFMVQDLSPAQKLLLPFHTLIAPLAKLAVPVPLSPVYDYPGAALMAFSGALCVLLTLLCVLLARRGEPSFLAAWGCFVVCSIPTAAVFASAIQPIADRYTYIAALSFPLLAGVWFDRLRARTPVHRSPRSAVLALVVLLCTAYGVLVVRQVPVWKSSLALWQHAVDVAPGSPFARNNLGEALVSAGYLEEAVVAYRVAATLHPRFPDALNNLGVALLMQGEHREGVAALERALELYDEEGGTDQAIPDVLFNLGTARFRMGDFRGAMVHFRRAALRRPGYLAARYYVGKTALAMGDSAGARVAWEEAARLGSADAEEELSRLGGR